ncbi:MAG: aminotransferase class I/II-fold pyridoxal phosphate-dependent enzyme, partial [Myxococcota bacterium]
AIEAAGLQVIGAAANFVAFTCPAGPKAAARLHQSLLDGGVFVRPLAMYGLHDALRVSVGAPDENLRFMELLSDHA